MTDTHSHTDKVRDDRTPPPGIEVIGDLPPGVPWWDAEMIGIKRAQLGFWGWMLVLFALALSFGFCFVILRGVNAFELIPFLIEVIPDADLFSQIFNLFLFLVAALVSVSAVSLPLIVIDRFGAGLLSRHILLIDHSEINWVDFTSLWQHWKKDGGEISAKHPLPNLQFAPFGSRKPTTAEISRGRPAQPEGLRITALGFDSHREIGSAGDLDVQHLASLLTYRIAKAKGENPPPPEFS